AQLLALPVSPFIHYTTLFRSSVWVWQLIIRRSAQWELIFILAGNSATRSFTRWVTSSACGMSGAMMMTCCVPLTLFPTLHLKWRSEEHTSELQSRENLVCRLL